MKAKFHNYAYLILGLIRKLCVKILTENSIQKKISYGLEIGKLYNIYSILLEKIDDYYDFDDELFGNKNLFQILKNDENYSLEFTYKILNNDIKETIIEFDDNILLKDDIYQLKKIIPFLTDDDNNTKFNLTNVFNEVDSYYQAQKADYINKLPVTAARPASIKKSPFKNFSVRNNIELITNKQAFTAFLHYVLIDVEVTATEICSLNILKYPKMPLDFFKDMSRQIWDEARHAQFIMNYLLSSHTRLEDFSYTGIVMDRYLKADSLEECIAIQQLLQEGNAIEVNIDFIDALNKTGNTELARQFEIVNYDEGVHVKIGNKWLKYLLKKTFDEADFDKEYIKVLLAASEKIDIPIFGKGCWNSSIRQKTDFPQAFIDAKLYFDENDI